LKSLSKVSYKENEVFNLYTKYISWWQGKILSLITDMHWCTQIAWISNDRNSYDVFTKKLLLEKNPIKTEFCDGNFFWPKIIKLGRNLRRFSVPKIFLSQNNLLVWDGIYIPSPIWDGFTFLSQSWDGFLFLSHILANFVFYSKI
jgi:hypothetical protein